MTIKKSTVKVDFFISYFPLILITCTIFKSLAKDIKM